MYTCAPFLRNLFTIYIPASGVNEMSDLPGTMISTRTPLFMALFMARSTLAVGVKYGLIICTLVWAASRAAM